MKTGTTSAGLRLLFLMVLAVSVSSARAGGRQETLEAIHHVENPFDSPRPGRCGELGAYQFRESTWRMHTRRPFAHALDRRASDEVAVAHYEWLRRGFERHGREATSYNIALAWNAGLAAVLRGKAPSSSHDYAVRVTAIADELSQRSVAMADR